MSTELQIQANRLNALKSTGPRTPEGKAASAQNALRSGLYSEAQYIYGESREDFPLLQREYFDRFRPSTPEERYQVDRLIRNEWMLRRLFRVESELWEYQAILADRTTGVQFGEAFTKASPIFMRAQRRLTLLERSYKEAFDELERLQRRQPADLPAPAAPPRPVPEPPEPAPAPPASEPLSLDSAPAANPPQPVKSKAPTAKLASFRPNSSQTPISSPQSPTPNP